MNEQLTLSGKDRCCLDHCDNIATEYTYDPESGGRIGFICGRCADACRQHYEDMETPDDNA